MKLLIKFIKNLANSDYAVIMLLFALVLVVGPFSANFFTPQNIMNVLVRTTVTATAAIGLTYVIITGGIDLSVGGTLVLVAYIGVDKLIDVMGINIFVAILMMIILGGIIGFLNGFSIVVLGMPPFIATLAMLGMTRGLSLLMFEAKTLYSLPELYVFFGQGEAFGIPIPILMFLLFFLIGFFILRNTVFGRSIYAVGNNKKAAWLAGINVNRTILLVYVISGVTAAIASIILTSKLEAVVASLGSGFELDVISAVVIGGTSLLGGSGNIVGSVVGALIISIVGNMLTLMRVSPFVQELSKGAVLWTAVLVDMARKGYIFKKPSE